MPVARDIREIIMIEDVDNHSVLEFCRTLARTTRMAILSCIGNIYIYLAAPARAMAENGPSLQPPTRATPPE